MARVLNTRPLLKELMLSLDRNGHPGYKLPLVGTLRSTIQDLWAYEAVVDNWPNYNSVILRPDRQQTLKFNFHQKNIYCYGDPDSFSTLVNQPDVIPWNKSIFFHAVPLHLVDCLEAAAQKIGANIENRHGVSPLNTIAMEHKDLKAKMEHTNKAVLQSKLPAGFTLGTMKPEHAELVLDSWSYSKYYFKPHDTEARESWLNELRQSIKHCITSAVYNSSGEIVSWQLIRLDGDSGLANTLPDYRKLGLYTHVGFYIMQQAYQASHDNFGYAMVTNTTSQHIMLDIFGHRRVGNIVHRFHEPNRANL